MKTQKPEPSLRWITIENLSHAVYSSGGVETRPEGLLNVLYRIDTKTIN